VTYEKLGRVTYIVVVWVEMPMRCQCGWLLRTRRFCRGDDDQFVTLPTCSLLRPEPTCHISICNTRTSEAYWEFRNSVYPCHIPVQPTRPILKPYTQWLATASGASNKHVVRHLSPVVPLPTKSPVGNAAHSTCLIFIIILGSSLSQKVTVKVGKKYSTNTRRISQRVSIR